MNKEEVGKTDLRGFNSLEIFKNIKSQFVLISKHTQS